MSNISKGDTKLKHLANVSPMLLEIEKQIIGILYVHDYVRSAKPIEESGFEDIELTQKGLNYLASFQNVKELSDEDVERYREVFPVGSRGSGKKIVKHRLELFIAKNSCTLDDIIDAAKMYIQHNTSKGYNIQAAHYFLYKRDVTSKIDESKCEEYLEQVRQLGPKSEDWRNKLV
jgi:hypothetical protein